MNTWIIPKKCWAPADTREIAISASPRVSISLYGAIGSGLKKPLFKCYYKNKTPSVADFFQLMVENLAQPDVTTYLILDNWSAHKPVVDVHRSQLKPLFYPPYSPRFNSK